MQRLAQIGQGHEAAFLAFSYTEESQNSGPPKCIKRYEKASFLTNGEWLLSLDTIAYFSWAGPHLWKEAFSLHWLAVTKRASRQAGGGMTTFYLEIVGKLMKQIIGINVANITLTDPEKGLFAPKRKVVFQIPTINFQVCLFQGVDTYIWQFQIQVL